MSKKPHFPPKRIRAQPQTLGSRVGENPEATAFPVGARFRKSRAARQKQILFILFPGFQILDAAGPLAAFEIATRFAPSAYTLKLASSKGGHVPSSSGVSMPCESLKAMRFAKVDTLIVVGGKGTTEAMGDTALLAAIKRAHKQARRTTSVCSGSFLLAAAGLLEGKRATTHWRRAPLMKRLYPNIRVEPDCIWTQDGKIWTSAGVTAGIDLALALIAEDLGADTATEVAREMVVYAQRPGGQTQHSTLLDLDRPGGRFQALHAWMQDHLAGDLTVEMLAKQAGMSPRNFARAYAQETGATPAKAVERMRLEAARAALEHGRSIQEIAARTGFGDSERMRRAFVRVFGAPPAALRRTLRRA